MSADLRVFVDSNILFSAALTGTNQFEAIWSLPNVEILTSQYSIAEVSRNLATADQRARLWHLIYRSHLVPDGDQIVLDVAVTLPTKDQPILRAAIEGRAHILITGDTRHFGQYADTTVQGVLIERPPRFRARFPDYFAKEAETQ